MAEILVRAAKDQNSVRATVGDALASDFRPKLNLSRWDGEVSFSVGHDLAGISLAQRTYSKIGDVYQLDTPLLTFKFYETPPDAQNEDGGIEFEIVLKQKPPTNALVLPIQTAGLNFFYQPELTAGEIAKGHYRPENVIGSYAVYHKTKRDDYTKLGGKNYRCGKAFHIYRPKLTDALGAAVWATLDVNVATGRLTITAPQTFLDAAIYPVIVDPTFGDDGIGASDYAVSANEAKGQSGAPGSTGAAESISVYCGTITAGSMKGFITDNAGAIISDGVANPSAKAATSWVVCSFGTQPTVTNGTTYYAAGISDTAWQMKYDAGTGFAEDDSNSYTTPQNCTWSTSAVSASIYCTYVDTPVLTQTNFRFFSAGDELPHYEAATVPVIEVGDIAGSGNNTAETSPDIAYPAHSSGDLIIQVLISDADAAHTNPGATGPNGETISNICFNQETGGTNGPHISVVYWVASANTNAGSQVWLIASEQWVGYTIVVPSAEYYHTTPIGSISNLGYNDSDGGTADMPAFTPNRSGGRVVCVGGVDTDPMAASYAPAGWTGRYTQDIGAVSCFCATLDALSVESQEVAAASFDINPTDSYCCIGFVVNGTVAVADGRTPLAVAGADPELEVDTDYGVSIRAENSGSATAEDTYKWQYKKNAGSWTAVTDTSSVAKASATGDFANGADVQEYITGAGTYVTNNNAALDTTGTLTLAAVLGASQSFESHLNFQIVSGDVADEDTVYLRLVYEDGTAFDSYGTADTNIPAITVNEAGGGATNVIYMIFES